MTIDVLVSEVGPRDGLQSIQPVMPLEAKKAWIAAEAAAGVREIEVGSFVPAKLLPQLADTADVVAFARTLPGLTVAALVPNLKGAEAAVAAGAHKITLPLSASETWGCGYLAPKPRMQYTSSSFAATLTSLFSGILRTHAKNPEIIGYFPKKSSFRSHVPEALLEGVYLPLFNSANGRLSLLRKLQNGKLYMYILYIVVTLVALLIWSHFRVRS